MSKSTDFLVIGAGAAGVLATQMLASSGKKITIVSKKIGGAYSVDGRNTFSILNDVASMYENYRTICSSYLDNEQELGTLDFKRIKKQVDTKANKISKIIENEIDEENIEYYEGAVSFLSENSVKITANGEELVYTFDKCLIATGAVPIKLPLLTGKKVLDIPSLTSLDSIPNSIIVIGGGITGMDVALLFSKFGSQVSIVEKGERILQSLDTQISKKYEDMLKKRNIQIYTKHEPVKIERIGQKYVLLFDDTKLESEEVIVCVGKKACVDGLELANAGVNLDENGIIQFGKDLVTDNPNIFVAGDITNVEMNVSWAYHSAYVAANNMLGANKTYDTIIHKFNTSSSGDMFNIGLTEEQSKEEGYDVGVVKFTASNIFKHIYTGDNNLFVKAVYNKEDKTFLGFQILGSGAVEFTSVFSYILQQKITPERLKEFVSSVPLFNEFFKEMLVKLR